MAEYSENNAFFTFAGVKGKFSKECAAKSILTPREHYRDPDFVLLSPQITIGYAQTSLLGVSPDLNNGSGHAKRLVPVHWLWQKLMNNPKRETRYS